MQLLLIVLGLCVAASAEVSPIWEDYHEEFGIAEAARIKATEESMDFDGARIVGGSHSTLGQHPHLGGLVIQLQGNRQSVCGSSLLSATRLLTAAHCWRHGNSQASQLTVVLGSVRLFSGGTRVNTRTVQLHANYNERTLNNDMAIIIINRIGLSNNVNIVNLASGSNLFVGSWAVAAGFGRTSDTANIGQNQLLSHVSLQVITNALCANSYGTSTIVASVICTGTANGRTSTCSGDSGGPLVIGTGAGRQLIGVTSFVHRAGCQSGHPAGFMRVTAFFNWIRQRM
ncbi:collagenase-like [Pararge aegeria]|uniref:Jg2277 protein n=1 Tax=Pararge aegeria aegeria TaxID=348720 RepID=A0A8S4RRJ2_9NEOP|nr:collagenase-like [Pararge aegeria]CAH2240265.1 jg2277 [Pararge aegeria aegeria]